MMPSRILFAALGAALVPALLFAQPLPKAQDEYQRHHSLRKSDVLILDQAGGTHNVGNIGLFFENRGKLYPHFESQGPSGEFPIHSSHEYIYRINPMVGLPRNVIQTHFTSDEEWSAVAGYHNRDSAQIAFSDRPYTWPASGWNVKDAKGNPVFYSDQDSYCVYSDSNNSKGILGIEVAQTGYDFSTKLAQNSIFFNYRITNRSANTYSGVFFGMYIDIDVGNASGGAEEYSDDKLGFDKANQLVYFYDSKGFSRDWNAPTGYFGVAFVNSPVVNGAQVGITDMHYNVYDDDYDIDTVQYGIMSSAPWLSTHPFWGSKYFHLGANAPNLHFDDPATIPAGGLDLVANVGSGPYTLGPGESISFVTIIVAGNTLKEITQNTKVARDLFAKGYAVPRPPIPPKVTVVSGDRRATIMWDNRSESSRDAYTGQMDFEGYRLYRSIDEGLHWDQIDRNASPTSGADPVPIADYDKVDGIGNDAGLRYAYVDSNLTNGFKYWYSVTAYDRGDTSSASLESARGNNTTAINFGLAIPRSEAIGRSPVSALTVSTIGSGTSNSSVTVVPLDLATAGNRSYEVQFAPLATIEAGNLRSIIDVGLDSSIARTTNVFAVVFTSPSTYRLRDLTRGNIVRSAGSYLSGTPISFFGVRLTLSDTATSASLLPEAGDSIVVRRGIRIRSGGIDVLPLQPFSYGTEYATSTGVLVQFAASDPIYSVTQTAGGNPLTVRATITNAEIIKDALYRVKVFKASYNAAQSSWTLGVQVVDTMNRVLIQDTAAVSGTTLTGGGMPGFSVTLVFGSDASLIPQVGTIVEVRAVKPRPPTYDDVFAFATLNARTDQARAASQLDRVKVVPNPYLVSSQYEQEFGSLRREPIRALKFNNLPPRCTVTIFTVTGDIVKTIVHDSDNGTEEWDLKADGKREIAPGVYIYLVKTDTAEKIGRFAVIK